MAQDRYDENHDACDWDENHENVIAWWADINPNTAQPVNVEFEKPLNIRGEITYPAKPEVKVGGSYKKFSIQFYEENEPINLINGSWGIFINDEDASDIINIIQEDNWLKVKFTGGNDYIGSVLKIVYTTTSNVVTSLDVNVVGL